MQRLHPAVEHLGRTRHVLDRGDLDPGRRGASPRCRRWRPAPRRARAGPARAPPRPSCRRPPAAPAAPPVPRVTSALPSIRHVPARRPHDAARRRAPRGRRREQPVLDLVHAGLERVPVVVVADLDGLLQHDRARVHPLVDEVHRDAGDFAPVSERVGDALRPREGGQQGGMHVQPAAAEGVERPRVRGPACTRRSPRRRSRRPGGGPPRRGRSASRGRPVGLDHRPSTPGVRPVERLDAGRSEITSAIEGRRRGRPGAPAGSCRRPRRAPRCARRTNSSSTRPRYQRHGPAQAVRYRRGSRRADPRDPGGDPVPPHSSAPAMDETTPSAEDARRRHPRAVRPPPGQSGRRPLQRVRGTDLPPLRGPGPRPRDRSRMPGRGGLGDPELTCPPEMVTAVHRVDG